MRRRLLVLASALAPALASCPDPVHADAVAAQGPEVPGIPEGPLHRAGHQCTICHGGAGPGDPQFIAGGTVYASRGSAVPLPGVTVTLTDRFGLTTTRVTNAVGNFYVFASDYPATFPLDVKLTFGDEERKMETKIGRDGGCALCHRGSGDDRHVPAVYLREVP